jgi:hypothetical protein
MVTHSSCKRLASGTAAVEHMCDIERRFSDVLLKGIHLTFGFDEPLSNM